MPSTSPHDPDLLANQLSPHYRCFDVANRLLFTGHSHQAWPDVAREGQLEAFDWAATRVDDKWQRALAKVDQLRDYLRHWYEDDSGLYCLGQNTHMLLCSWLSSLDWTQKPRLVTSDGEFHSLFRQLQRLQETGIEVEFVATQPLETFADRLCQQLHRPTTAVLISRVLFGSSLIVPSLNVIAEHCLQREIPLLLDDYHGTNVSRLSLAEEPMSQVYLVTGGYKYLQWGEGNCFLRYPQDCQLKPVMTGWYGSFSTLDQPRTTQQGTQPVAFDREQKFASATYDPTSQFRAARVVEFFRQQQLSPERLQQQYQAQIHTLQQCFLALQLPANAIQLAHPYSLAHNGGFLALRSPRANQLCEALKKAGVLTDSRGDILRFGVAPYIHSNQIEQAMGQLKDVVLNG